MSQQINLYEDRLRPRLELATGRNLSMSALLLLLLMGAWSYQSSLDASRKALATAALAKTVASTQDTLQQLSQTLAQRKLSPALSAELENTRAKLAAGQELLDLLDSGKLGHHGGFSAFMTGFARQARDDLWLTGFQISQGGEAIEIRGRLFEPSRLADYVQRLNGVAVFQGRRFAALDMQHVTPDEKPGESTAKAEKAAASSDTARPVVEFTLRSQLDHEGKEALTGKGMP